MQAVMRRGIAAGAAIIVLAACGVRSSPEVAHTPLPDAMADDGALPQAGLPAPGQALPSKPPAAAPPVAAGDAVPIPSADRARMPRELAAALESAERTIRDLDAADAQIAAAAHEQQIAYRRLVRRPAWRKRVVGHLAQDLRPAARRNIHAGARLLELVTPQPELPDWRIRRPAPAAGLRADYRRAGDAFGIRWQYLAAIHLVETRMGRIRGTSTAGAQGPMQFMPATWAAYGRGDINDNGDAIMAAARYLAANGAPQAMRRALWRYNHSDRYVDAVSAYARTMMAEPRTYRGYYHWQVYYMTVEGDVLLPVGYRG